MRPLAILFAISASVLVAGLVLQVFLAGLGVFDDPTFFLTHRDTGYTLELVAFVVFLLAAIARAGRRQGSPGSSSCCSCSSPCSSASGTAPRWSPRSTP
jgi:hypothetical protein